MELTKEIVFDVMKQRGYESTGLTNGEGNLFGFVKRLTQGPSIHAKVLLKSGSISLYFIDLKYFCQLSAEGMAFDHKDFEKYEQIISMYAAKCLDIDVFEVLNNWLEANEIEEEQELIKEKKTIAERKAEFWNKVREKAKGKYSKELAIEFYNKWTEMNEGGRKMRFEMQKIFEVSKRLVTWAKNDKNWSKTFVDNKIEKQNEKQTVDNNKIVNTKDKF